MRFSIKFGDPLNISCDVLSYTVGMNFPSHASAGHVRAGHDQTGQVQRAQSYDLTALKPPDHLTAMLAQYSASGTLISEVLLNGYRAENTKEPIVRYRMKSVLITKVRFGQDKGADEFSLDAKSIDIDYIVEEDH